MALTQVGNGAMRDARGAKPRLVRRARLDTPTRTIRRAKPDNLSDALCKSPRTVPDRPGGQMLDNQHLRVCQSGESRVVKPQSGHCNDGPSVNIMAIIRTWFSRLLQTQTECPNSPPSKLKRPRLLQRHPHTHPATPPRPNLNMEPPSRKISGARLKRP